MSKKTNPRKKPLSQADIKKAKNLIAAEMVENVWTLVFSVLRDKENATTEDLHRIWGEINDLSDSVLLGYVNMSDLKNVLKQEEGLVFTRGR